VTGVIVIFKWLRYPQLLLLLAVIMPVASANAEAYRLNAGDILDISVWKEEGMQRQVLILPDGTISFPLAGHLTAAGRTAAEVQDALAKRIQVYIPEPVVTVSVASVGGNSIYVIGQVKLPGRFDVTSQIDVMQALSLAGGLTPFGDENSIRVLRRSGNKQTAVRFDYSAVKRGQHLETNILLQPGDVVVVPD
jgi:polysaccharide export outer membrane protein